MKKITLLSWLILGLFMAAKAVHPLPELNSRVTDKTETLSPYQIRLLEDKLKRPEDSVGIQLVVVMIPTTGEESIEAYSMRLAEKWKIGQKGVDNGVILLVAKDDRRMRIEVGYGFEGALTDARASVIINELIAPEFRNGNFAAGIQAGTDAIIQIAYGEEFALPENKEDNSVSSFTGILITILVIGLFIGVIILIAKYKFKAILIIAGALFLITFLIAGIAVALSIMFVIFIFGATILGIVSGGGRGSSGGWSGSSGSSGFSGGSSGFSGGGGSFGGGGASGGW